MNLLWAYPYNPISAILPLALTTLNFDYCKRPLISPLASCSCCSDAKLCLTLSDPMYYSMQGFPVLHHLQEFAQTHVHRVSDAIQPSHPLSPPSPFAFNVSQHQGLYQWVSSSYQVAKVWEFQYQYFQWLFWVDFLTDQFDLLAVRRTLERFLRHHSWKASILWCSALYMVKQ